MSGATRRQRRTVARGLAGALRRARRPHEPLCTVVPLRARELLACRPLVLEVIEGLIDDGHDVSPEAVALARRLLCDGCGPLYCDGDLERALRELRRELAAPLHPSMR